MAYKNPADQHAAELKYSKSPKGRTTRKKYRDLYYKTKKGRINSMFGCAKRRARIKGLKFTIEKKDIVIPHLCPLLRMELNWSKFGIRYDSPSLDRKNPDDGYTPENIWVISSRANLLKNNATLSEMQALVNNWKCELGEGE